MNIKRHTLINFLSLLFILACNLTVSVIIATTLGPQGKGMYFLVFMVATTVFTIVHSSLPVAAVYYIGIKKSRNFSFMLYRILKLHYNPNFTGRPDNHVGT